MAHVTEIVLDKPFAQPTLMVVNVRRTRVCALRVWTGAMLLSLASRVLGVPVEVDFVSEYEGPVLH